MEPSVRSIEGVVRDVLTVIPSLHWVYTYRDTSFPVGADHGPPLGPGRGPRGGLPWRILLSDPGYAGQSAVKGLPRWVRTRSCVRPTRGCAHLRVRVPALMHEGGGPRVASPTTDRGSGSHRLPQVRHVRVRSTPSRWNPPHLRDGLCRHGCCPHSAGRAHRSDSNIV